MHIIISNIVAALLAIMRFCAYFIFCYKYFNLFSVTRLLCRIIIIAEAGFQANPNRPCALVAFSQTVRTALSMRCIFNFISLLCGMLFNKWGGERSLLLLLRVHLQRSNCSSYRNRLIVSPNKNLKLKTVQRMEITRRRRRRKRRIKMYKKHTER